MPEVDAAGVGYARPKPVQAAQLRQRRAGFEALVREQAAVYVELLQRRQVRYGGQPEVSHACSMQRCSSQLATCRIF